MGTLSGDLVLNAPTTHIVASDSLQIDDMRIAGDEIFALSDSDIEIMVRPLSTAILCCYFSDFGQTLLYACNLD